MLCWFKIDKPSKDGNAMSACCTTILSAHDDGESTDTANFFNNHDGLHGFYSSRSYLADLCNNPDTFIIGVQEHWLTPSNLHLLNSVHPDFACYAISSMNNKLTSGVFRGRPFGGVAFLWRKTIANNIEIISSEDSGRCLCV